MKEIKYLGRDGRYLSLVLNGYAAYFKFKKIPAYYARTTLLLLTYNLINHMFLNLLTLWFLDLWRNISCNVLSIELSQLQDILVMMCTLFASYSIEYIIQQLRHIILYLRLGKQRSGKVKKRVDRNQVKETSFTSSVITGPGLDDQHQTRFAHSVLLSTSNASYWLVPNKSLWNVLLSQLD